MNEVPLSQINTSSYSNVRVGINKFQKALASLEVTSMVVNFLSTQEFLATNAGLNLEQRINKAKRRYPGLRLSQ